MLLPSKSEEPAAQPSLAEQVRWLTREADDPQAAIALAQQYLAADPTPTMERQRVHYELAVGYWFAEDHAAALATFRQVVADYQNVELDRTSADFKVDDAQFFVGRFELDHGDRAEGLEALAQLIAGFPESDRRPEAMHALACELAIDGQFEQGRALALSLATDYVGNPLEPQAFHYAVAYLLSPEASGQGPTRQGTLNKQEQTGNLAEAKTYVEALISRHPNAPETVMSVQQVMWHYAYVTFEYEEAEPWARRIIELFPGTRAAAEAHLDLAKLGVHVREDFDAAYPLIDEAMAWALGHEDWGLLAMAMHARGQVLNREQRFDEAREAFLETLAFVDEHAEAEWLRIETKADYAGAYFSEGEWLAAQDETAAAQANYVAASQEYAAAVNRHADDVGWAPYLKFRLGLSYLKAGDRAGARQTFLRLVDEYPDNNWAWLAFSYMDLGRPRPERPAAVRIDEEENQ